MQLLKQELEHSVHVLECLMQGQGKVPRSRKEVTMLLLDKPPPVTFGRTFLWSIQHVASMGPSKTDFTSQQCFCWGLQWNITHVR